MKKYIAIIFIIICYSCTMNKDATNLPTSIECVLSKAGKKIEKK